MRIELKDIRDFLAGCEPFVQLPDAVLDSLPSKLHIQYLRRGSAFPPEKTSLVYIVRQGAIELRDNKQNIIEKLSEGSIYTANCSVTSEVINLSAIVTEDCLVYTLPCAELAALRNQFEHIEHYFKDSLRERLQHVLAMQQAGSNDNYLYTRVADIIRHEPVSVSPQTTIQSCARLMAEKNISSLLIIEDDRLVGIVTDRDLRNRCLAQDIDAKQTIRSIMTEQPRSIAPISTVAEAQQLMSQLNLHHLPVEDGRRLLGMISSSDLARLHSSSPMHLISAINNAVSLDELAEHSKMLPEQQRQLLSLNATAQQVGIIISSLADAIIGKLFAFAEQQLGPSPVAYSWFAIGSLGRRELTSHSDQDNAIILADDFDPARHSDYFSHLTRFVSDGLNACGFYYCPGDVMATNPQWRQTLHDWKTCFSRWVSTPEPKALLLACNFFDLRHIHGDSDIFDSLQKHAVAIASGNKLFHAYLASNAMQQHPPLGFFRQFLLIHGGEHDDTFDLKLRGLLPVTDLARLFALVEGVTEVNTYERLQAVAGSASLSKEGADNLLVALEVIARLRLQHQVDQHLAGRDMDNYINPATLSELEKNHLKDVFSAIRTVQESVAQRYQVELF